MARAIHNIPLVHPGEVLRVDYLGPLGMRVNALSVALAVPATRIHEIVKERRSITADTNLPKLRVLIGPLKAFLNKA